MVSELSTCFLFRKASEKDALGLEVAQRVEGLAAMPDNLGPTKRKEQADFHRLSSDPLTSTRVWYVSLYMCTQRYT